jgi:hypothetical protein
MPCRLDDERFSHTAHVNVEVKKQGRRVHGKHPRGHFNNYPGFPNDKPGALFAVECT